MMDGELLTRVTIWIALSGYALGAASLIVAWKKPRLLRLARVAWTAGCLVYLAHVFCAFHFYHDWSHSTAYQETARQTADTVGLEFGAGLFVTYAFTVAWVTDVTAWWARGLDSYLRRSRILLFIWHAFFAFIVFNGTVVFESGPSRWFGLALCLSLAGVWWRTHQPRRRLSYGSLSLLKRLNKE
jgi:hypothetical protein